MSDMDKLLSALRERAKELNCLYDVEKLLTRKGASRDEVLERVADAMTRGWQYPEVCAVRIEVEGSVFQTANYAPTRWTLIAPLCLQDETVGRLEVCYLKERPQEDHGPFLKEEKDLIDNLADRIGNWLLFRKLDQMGRKWEAAGAEETRDSAANWKVLIDLLRETDEALYLRMARKMLNHLCSVGVHEAQSLLREVDSDYDPAATGTGEVNVPDRRSAPDIELLRSGRPFEVAARFLSGDEIVHRMQEWMQGDKASMFLKILENPRSTLDEVREGLRRFHQLAPDGTGLPESTLKGARVALSQRVLTEQLDFVQTAKNEVPVEFFRGLLDRVVMTRDSHGKLGGKAAGMLLAYQILRNRGESSPLGDIRIPRTWYIASDAVLDFIAYNDLDDMLHQKYKSIDEVRSDYPNIVRLFKNSSFPPELISGLSSVLDDFEGKPLIIRSSSLLEDRLGSAFSGKYKSLFLPNQGTKKECLDALLDAVAEVYASMFAPDPIQYRRERGVLEYDEQMGILIQEVIGKQVGRYYFPAFAGVAFSRNEFRWSPRIVRDDGLVRIVPGMGTRAVDRTGDDYPVLIVPGKPALRANLDVDEIVRYSPRQMDVVDLQDNRFLTVEISDLLKEVGGAYPAFNLVFSSLEDGRLVQPLSVLRGSTEKHYVAGFDGLRSQETFARVMSQALCVLEEQLQCPVDVEFAHDGEHLYLLQCRPQSQSDNDAPAPIPRDLPEGDIIFTASRFVSNRRMADIRHIVYVDPGRYGELSSHEEMKAVGRVVGELNRLLPKKQFILMGPGRWGSRGDIKLGVSVTYADISHTAMLIEIARSTGGYVPDVSFGTHFFQDLVEAGIGYLPIYPDDEGILFNERFLLGATNYLSGLFPEYEHLADVVRVIDVEEETDGRVLKILLNADLDEAVACLAEPGGEEVRAAGLVPPVCRSSDQYWRWRQQMAERIAAEVDHQRLGVVGMYLFGSVKNAVAGPASDIDLLIHFRGDESQEKELLDWLRGWSLALGEFNYQRTGYRTDGLLDVHLVTDEDIANHSSYAVKIGAVTDAARELPLE